MINTFPQNEEELRAAMLLSLIIDVSKSRHISGISPYAPENRLVEANLARWKKEYFAILKSLAS